MAEAEKIAYLGDGSLNALVIQHGTKADLGTVVRRAAENTGSLPGPAEIDLHSAQSKVVLDAITRATCASQEDCELGYFARFKAARVGDAGQAVRVTFICEREDECCMRGLEAAVSSINADVTAAKAAIENDPLAKFSG